MDRTPEFLEYVKEPIKQSTSQEQPFYYEILERVSAISSQLKGMSNIKTLLRVEEAFLREQRRTLEILDAVRITQGACLAQHYEGIKYIVNQRMLALSKQIRSAKMNCGTNEQFLTPEKPQHFRKSSLNMQLELENRKIIQKEEYEVAKQHLASIETYQRMIHENLVIQDERIDSISGFACETKTIYNELNRDDDGGSGSFMRRMTLNMILCLSFVLIFLHFFYK